MPVIKNRCTGRLLDKGLPRYVGSRGRHRINTDVKIDVIEQVSSHKILGVVIDSQMNYESHIDELCKKRSKRTLCIGLLKHISPSKGNLLQWCYKTHPPVWEYDMGQLQYRTSSKYLKLQKRAGRIILVAERLTSMLKWG